MVSATVIAKDFSLALPAWSVAVQVTVVRPKPNSEALGGSQVTGVDPSTRSVAVASNSGSAPAGRSASTSRSSGTSMTGPVVSTTVTVKVLSPVLPASSVAEQVTVFAPSGKVLPDPGEQVVATFPSTASVAVASYVVLAPPGPVASMVRSSGTATAGAVVSSTVTSNAFCVMLSVVVHGGAVDLGAAQGEAVAGGRNAVDGHVVVGGVGRGHVVLHDGAVRAGRLGGHAAPGRSGRAGRCPRRSPRTTAMPVLPRVSVAVHDTVVSPKPNVAPRPASRSPGGLRRRRRRSRGRR